MLAATAAALLGRHRRHQGARQDRHGVRQAARDVPAHPGELVRGDGRPADQGPLGHRQPDLSTPGRARHRDRAPARRDARRAAGRGVRPQHRPAHRPARPRRQQATGSTTPPGWPARTAARRPTSRTWSRPTRSTTRSGRWPTRSSRTSAREGRACARVHLKVRFAPFFTFNRSRKLPEPTFDADVIADAALDLLRQARGRPAHPAARRTRRDGAARGRLRRARAPMGGAATPRSDSPMHTDRGCGSGSDCIGLSGV